MGWKDITKEELKNLINTNTYVGIGKMFNISGTAVKKKAKKFDIWERCHQYHGHNDHLKIENLCLWCGGKVNRWAGKYCNAKCTKDHQYHIYINKWLLGVIDGTQLNGNVSGYIKTYLKNKHNNKCSKCGWNTPNPFINSIILDIHHIDGDHTNNKESNLELLCPNCHSLTETYGSLNIGNGKKLRNNR